jgi:hypothetical protein
MGMSYQEQTDRLGGFVFAGLVTVALVGVAAVAVTIGWA